MEQNSQADIPLYKRDDPKPKMNMSEELASRIKGLEEARAYSGYSPADVAAIDRTIASLKLKHAELTKPKEQSNA